MRSFFIFSLLFLLNYPSFANDDFVIDDIKLQGLEKIPDGTLLNYLPLKIGDVFDYSQSSYVLQELYKTGFFKDIKLYRDDDTLIVEVHERPAIASVTFDGNSDIEDEQLEEVLENIGISKGRVFNPSALDKIEIGLKQQAYYSRGKYAVKIDTKVTELERNRVDIEIDISEGVVARIKQVNIVGNEVYDDDTLLSELQLGVPGFFDWFSSSDEYAKPKLAADEETIRSYYQDRGYVKFSVDSTQVTITPDRKDIYITMNVTEGDKYSVGSTLFSGDLKFEESDLFKLVLLEKGETFSRSKMVESQDLIKRMYGNEGYAFAKIKVLPEIDDDNKSVNLTYLISPGSKVYVRRINFSGNYKTQDEVLRREMRLMEGGELSNSKLDRSKIRLQRLPYIEEVNLKTIPVPGTDDLVDVDISVSERLTGSFNIGAGFSQNQGFVFNMGLTMENLNGTGEKLDLNFSNDKANQIYSVSFTDPYYTIDGISRTLAFSYRERDASEEDVINYLQNSYGANIAFGIPLSEFDRIRVGIGYEVTEIIRGTTVVTQDVLDFLSAYGNGETVIDGEDYEADVSSYTLLASFVHDTRNRTVFATRGNQQSVALDMTAPGSDLQYYKLTYRNKFYFPVTKALTALVRTDLAYGDGYSDTEFYPFYERFYAGGLRTVRGFDSNSLGPKSLSGDAAGEPIGGDLRTVASAELIFPVPFVEKPPSTVRFSAFYDIGNVFLRDDVAENGFDGGFKSSELRSSVGVSFVWLAPIGPLRFSWAQPLDKQAGDDTQSFQFSIGSFF